MPSPTQEPNIHPHKIHDIRREEMLGSLKGISEVRTAQELHRHHDHTIPKHSVASDIQSAFGKLASATAKEEGVDAGEVQREVVPIFPENAETSFEKEAEIAQELHHEAIVYMYRDYGEKGYLSSTNFQN